MTRAAIAPALLIAFAAAGPAAADPPPGLAARAREVLKAHCYRCHGQDGAVEGGFNYVLDRDKLVAASAPDTSAWAGRCRGWTRRCRRCWKTWTCAAS